VKSVQMDQLESKTMLTRWSLLTG